MEFIPLPIARYAEEHSMPEPEYLHRLNRETHLKVMQPRMLSGHLQGRILSMLSKLITPKNILEIGTYTGYSALCLAEGLAKDGHLHTIDNNPERAELVNRYIAKAGLETQITHHVGTASELIPQIEGLFDLVFIDADKSNYLRYWEMLEAKLKRGTVVLLDNVLWSGKVLQSTASGDIDTEVLKLLNERISSSADWEAMIIPIRDGITLARKK
jgi:predicted O-methyltransferase YrrM